MSSFSILAAGFQRITNAWADLPLRIKGPVVVAIPVAALLGGVLGFGLALRADHQSDVCLERLTVLVSAIQDCLAEIENGPCPSAAAFDNKFRSLEFLLRDDPDQLDRLRHIQRTLQSAGGREFANPAKLLRGALKSLGLEQQKRLLARAASLRRRAFMALAGDAVLGVGGGILGILLISSALARVSCLGQNAALLEQRLPLLPWPGGHDELGSLNSALEKSGASLRRTEEQRDRLFTLSLDMQCTMMLDGGFCRVNPAFTTTLGLAESSLIGRHLLDFVHPEDRQSTAGELAQLSRGSPIAFLRHRFLSEDGSYKWLTWSIAPSLSEGLAYGVAHDCTRQIRDEQALRDSNDRLVAVLERTTDAFFALDRDWRLTYVNSHAERVFRCSRSSVLGRNLWEVFPQGIGSAVYKLCHQVMGTGAPGHIEEYSEMFECWLEVHAYASADGLSVYFRDITERRQAEAKIIRALKDNEVLLREVHHRVKNNLQVICSMLRLQAGYMQDEKLHQVLRDSRERVYAMALLHDQLHRARDLSSVDLSEYIRSLASSLFCSYGVDSAQIALRLDLQPITVSFDTAIPCGLIVHELVSNALRHAFPDNGRGQVWLGLRAKRCRVELTVSDDGVGLPETSGGVHVRSLGLRLVKLLAEQMEATVERTGAPGTRFRFRFSIKNQLESNSK